MLIRFCTLVRDPDSHSPQGVFQAALRLRNAGQMEAYEEAWLESELSWLRMHLPSPGCLRDRGNQRAICWFRHDASRPIGKVRGIVALLESKGIVVEMVTSADPGKIIYQDRWQVVAKPLRNRR